MNSTTAFTQPKKLQDEKGAAATRFRPERSHSFHGRSAALTSDHRQLGRPKTQPDLLASTRARKSGTVLLEPRAPAKVLLNVTVQGSLSPVQVMAPAEWTVEEMVAAAVRVYVKEGRRPRLASMEPGAFGLHYSQFSMECLDSKEKLSVLGSRNFFLCPKSISAAVISSSTHSSSSMMSVSSRSCFQDIKKVPEISSSTHSSSSMMSVSSKSCFQDTKKGPEISSSTHSSSSMMPVSSRSCFQDIKKGHEISNPFSWLMALLM